MPTPSSAPSTADVGAELVSLSAGLGIITMALFPFALPLLVLVVGPLALLALPVLLLAGLLVLPFWLARVVRRSRSGRRGDARSPASTRHVAVHAGPSGFRR